MGRIVTRNPAFDLALGDAGAPCTDGRAS